MDTLTNTHQARFTKYDTPLSGWYVETRTKRLPSLAIARAEITHTTTKAANGVTYDHYEVEVAVQSPTGDSSDLYRHTYPMYDLAPAMDLLRSLMDRTMTMLAASGWEIIEN